MNLPDEFEEESKEFRSIAIYVQWVDEWLEKINSDPTNKRAALTHRGTFKVFYEEVYPLSRLLKLKASQWAGAEFRSIMGSQSYDVETRNHDLQYYEVACCDFDDEENFRMGQYLDKGHVSLLSSVTRDERGRPNGFDDDGCKRHSEVIARYLDVIRQRIMKKCNKVYPAKTGLIIYSFDYLIDSEDMSLYDELLAETKPLWETKFPVIYIIGPKGEFHFEATA